MIGENSGWENMPEKVRELLEEFRTVTGKVGLLDTILPPIIFLLLNGLAGFTAAMFGALGLAALIAISRLRLGQSLVYALAGMGSVGLAIALALLLGRSEGFFSQCLCKVCSRHDEGCSRSSRRGRQATG